MDIRLIGPPDVIQAWAGMMRESYKCRDDIVDAAAPPSKDDA